jgi:hypothetical protein
MAALSQRAGLRKVRRGAPEKLLPGAALTEPAQPPHPRPGARVDVFNETWPQH